VRPCIGLELHVSPNYCGQEPPTERSLPCRCGQTARYRGTRSKPILTAVGEAQMLRPYYLCPHGSQGQFPADRALDVEHTELSPGVRRMLGLVGSECSSFNRGREQIHALAGLEVATKTVERVAEALGGDIADREQAEMDQALQLDLPVAVGSAVPVMYVQIDSTGVPVVRKETTGRAGRNPGEPPRPRDVKLGCVFIQTRRDRKGRPVRDQDSTTYTGAVESATEFSVRIYAEAHRRGWNRAQNKVVMGDGADWIWNTSQEQFPGVNEAGCKTVIGDRLKRSGMFWTVRGANAIIALRCCRLSGRFEDYWEARRR
jgi:hypothetical protein